MLRVLYTNYPRKRGGRREDPSRVQALDLGRRGRGRSTFAAI